MISIHGLQRADLHVHGQKLIFRGWSRNGAPHQGKIRALKIPGDFCPVPSESEQDRLGFSPKGEKRSKSAGFVTSALRNWLVTVSSETRADRRASASCGILDLGRCGP
jgi:hypothetical protein